MSTFFQGLLFCMGAGCFFFCALFALVGGISKDERNGVRRDVTPSEAQW